ncbi:type VII secretion integral membrane protein EccD [Amycolatopsis rhizosphaerae]|uniref:Type VII secretion integral membrane protein EccD n=1 Tax=Amycolatopsis rhizosphaerae TaxID=2053003 RepID=A0A558DKT6_9PSEU|nr:type VII secretion integral membrane protein EccD [Amycolatopsis rhizosphaerae]TVT61601.1 type VII secretion integral membrane protein EccD [Amycolatopsis rhizosphaerae]
MTTTESRGATEASQLTRITLVGPRHRIDLVLPSHERIGTLLPEMVAMVGHKTPDVLRGYQVSTIDGRVLEPGTSLRAAQVADGALLRIDPLTEAPPAPIVHDVSDELADDLARRRGRWAEGPRQWTATLTVAGAALLAARLALRALGPTAATVIGLVILAAGCAAALLGRRAVGLAILLAGAAIGMSTVPEWTASAALRSTLWTAGAAITVLVYSLATRQQRAGLFGAGTLLVLLGLWAALVAFRLPAERAAAVVAVLSVGVLGILPRAAMMISGLTHLDDRQGGGGTVARTTVESAVDSAHRGLALATVATAVSSALAGLTLAQAGNGWAIGLASLLVVTLLLRLRAFPLAAEVISLVMAALAVAVGLVVRWMTVAPTMWWGGAAVAVAIALAGLGVLGFEPEQHIRAQARQIADRLEALAVAALVPVAVGVFQVYAQLLHTF